MPTPLPPSDVEPAPRRYDLDEVRAAMETVMHTIGDAAKIDLVIATLRRLR